MAEMAADKREGGGKCPVLQRVLKVVMLLSAAVLVTASTWLDQFAYRQHLMWASGGVLSVCCLVFALLNKEQLKNRKEES